MPETSTSTFAELPDSGVSSQDDGTCPLLLSGMPVHYPSEPNSPCPAVEPCGTDPEACTCPGSLVGARCAYPSARNPDFMDVADCHAAPLYNFWLVNETVCRRTGDDCLSGVPLPGTVSGPRIELTSSCDSRPVVSCSVVPGGTVQMALDDALRAVVQNCLGTAQVSNGTLAVWFDGDCPTSFMVDRPELANCVKAELEVERFGCALGLLCGVGFGESGCDLC